MKTLWGPKGITTQRWRPPRALPRRPLTRPVETGRLETLMRKKAADRTGSADNWEQLKAPLPFARAASPEEIGAMAAMLASDRSAYTSGTVVTIDGGIASQSRSF